MNLFHSYPSLTFTATTGAEVVELCKHFNLSIADLGAEIGAGTMTHTSQDIKRPWFAISSDVPYSYLKPYYDLLLEKVAYDGAPFAITDDRLRYLGGYCKNLCHTHIVEGAYIDADGYHAVGFIQPQSWDGKPAAERAPRLFNEHLRASLGETKSEPEFIEMSGSLLRRNPNYMKRHQPQPAVASAALFELLFEHWLANHASDAQRDILAEGDACHRGVCRDSLAASFLCGHNNGFYIDNYKRLVTFDELKGLA